MFENDYFALIEYMCLLCSECYYSQRPDKSANKCIPQAYILKCTVCFYNGTKDVICCFSDENVFFILLQGKTRIFNKNILVCSIVVGFLLPLFLRQLEFLLCQSEL